MTGTFGVGDMDPLASHLRGLFKGPLILNSNFDTARAQAELSAGIGDAVAFGRPFIANPVCLPIGRRHSTRPGRCVDVVHPRPRGLPRLSYCHPGSSEVGVVAFDEHGSRDMQTVSCAKELGDRFGIVEIWPDEPPPGREVWLECRSDLRRVARLRAVMDHLRSAVPKEV